jgi:hypothetical protein
LMPRLMPPSPSGSAVYPLTASGVIKTEKEIFA